MTITFPCTVYSHPQLGSIVLPYVTVILRAGTHEIAGEFLLDSGADITLIPRGIGELLGFTLADAEIADLGDLQAVLPVVFQTVEMQIGPYSFAARVAWALSEDVPLILGRLDVFDRFDIELVQRHRYTAFRWAAPDQPTMGQTNEGKVAPPSPHRL